MRRIRDGDEEGGVGLTFEGRGDEIRMEERGGARELIHIPPLSCSRVIEPEIVGG